MQVKNIMIPADKIITTKPDSTVLDVMKLMVNNKVSSLLVLDADNAKQVAGIVTTYDIMKAVVDLNGNASGKSINTIMSKEIISISENDILDNAMKKMDEHRTHHLVVEDTEGLSGIISSYDFVKDRSLASEIHPWIGPDVFSLPDYME